MKEGSIEEVTARLRLWCSRPGRGLARVEWDSAYSRREVVKRLRESLTDVAVTELEAPSDGTPFENVDQLLAELGRVEGGVVSITGVEGVFPEKQRRLETLSALSFQRETLASFPVRQIWWIPSHLTELLVLGVPDLDSWFQLRLHLTEVIIPETAPEIIEELREKTVSPEEARALAQRFWERLQTARGRDVPDEQIWSELAFPAARALDLADLGEEADEIMAEIPHAQSILQSTLDGFRVSEGPLSPEALYAEERLAALLARRGDLTGARALQEHVLTARRQRGGDSDKATLLAMVNLVSTLAQTDLAAARRISEELLVNTKQMFGDAGPATLGAMQLLASVMVEQGDLAAAERLEKEVAEMRERQAREQVSQAQ